MPVFWLSLHGHASIISLRGPSRPQKNVRPSKKVRPPHLPHLFNFVASLLKHYIGKLIHSKKNLVQRLALLLIVIFYTGPPQPIFSGQGLHSGGHISCRHRFLFCKIQARPRPWGALPAMAALSCHVRSTSLQFSTLWTFLIVLLADIYFIFAFRNLPDMVSFT